jgi:hypothetical protein
MRIAVAVCFVALALSTSANGQTSSQIAAQDPVATYSYFKRTLERLGIGADAVAERGRQSDGSVTLSDCVGASWYIGGEGGENSAVSKIANLAYDVLFMRTALQVAGYPQSLWDSEVLAYERANLREIDRYGYGLSPEFGEHNPIRNGLVEKLNDYNRRSNRRYKTVTPAHEGCGGGEVEIIIRTSPRAQRVQYINRVKYDLCGFQGIDPNGSSCDHWVDYASQDGRGAEMSGKYKVRVTWSDGTIAFRDLNVDDLPRGQDLFDPRTFSIRKQ